MRSRLLRPVLVVSAFALSASACKKSDAGPTGEPSPESNAEAVQAKTEAPAASDGPTDCSTLDSPSSIEEDTFKVAIKPVDTYQQGASSRVDVELVAKGGYHTNDKYPYKFKVEPCPGLSYPAEVVPTDRVSLTTETAVMPVDFVPKAKGEQRVAGVFSFSVCSEENCLVEKRPLSLKIQVQ